MCKDRHICSQLLLLSFTNTRNGVCAGSLLLRPILRGYLETKMTLELEDGTYIKIVWNRRRNYPRKVEILF